LKHGPDAICTACKMHFPRCFRSDTFNFKKIKSRPTWIIQQRLIQHWLNLPQRRRANPFSFGLWLCLLLRSLLQLHCQFRNILNEAAEPPFPLRRVAWARPPTPPCSRTPSSRGSCPSCTASVASPCKFGTRKVCKLPPDIHRLGNHAIPPLPPGARDLPTSHPGTRARPRSWAPLLSPGRGREGIRTGRTGWLGNAELGAKGGALRGDSALEEEGEGRGCTGTRACPRALGGRAQAKPYHIPFPCPPARLSAV
jgi:hypothetical protein